MLAVILPLLLLATESIGAAEKIRSVSRQRQFPGLQFVDAGAHPKDDSFAYVTCGEPFEGPEKSCALRLESNGVDGVTYADACELLLRSKLKDGLVGRHVKLFEFLKSKYVVVWQDRREEETLLRLTLVELPGCSKSEQQIVAGELGEVASMFSAMDVLGRNSSVFDLVFPSEPLCGDRLCRLSFDASGRRLGEPRPWIPAEPNTRQDFYPIDDGRGSHLLLSTFSDHYTVSIAGSDGAQRELHKHARTTKESTAVSTANGALGVCFVVDASLRCSQFGPRGEPKLELAVGFPYASPHSAVHNLAGGGFLLMTTMCSSRQPCLYDGNRFYVTKVDAAGRRYRSLELQGFDCNFNTQRLLAGFHRHPSGGGEQHCLSLICAKMKDGEQERFSLATTCFLESVVSVSF